MGQGEDTEEELELPYILHEQSDAVNSSSHNRSARVVLSLLNSRTYSPAPMRRKVNQHSVA